MLWPLAEPSRRDVTSEWTQHGSLVTTYSSGKITHASDIHHFLRLCHCLIIEILICVLQCITVKQTKYKLVPFSPASYVLRKAPADLKSTYMSKTRHDLHASYISKLSLKKRYIYLHELHVYYNRQCRTRRCNKRCIILICPVRILCIYRIFPHPNSTPLPENIAFSCSFVCIPPCCTSVPGWIKDMFCSVLLWLF